MYKYFSIAALLLFFASTTLSQGPEGHKELKGHVILLAHSINKGYTQKAWKKEGEAWNKTAESASDYASVAASLKSLEGFLSDKAFSKRPKLSGGTSPKEVTSDMLAFISATKPGVFSTDVKEIKEKLKNDLAAIKVKEDRKKAAEEAKAMMQPFVDGVKAELPGLFEDAKKNRFANSGTVKFSDVPVKIVTKTEDGAEMYLAQSEFNCGSEVDMAKQLCKSLEPVINQSLPDTYTKRRDFSAGFKHNIYAHVWEHQSEKFYEMATKPTVSVGVKKDGADHIVVVWVMEPIER